MAYKRKHLLGLQGASKEEILFLLQKAKEFKALNNQDIKKTDLLKGKTIVNAFFENSTRTRVSFEIAAKRLGADGINFSTSQSSTKKGETIIDTIKNLEAMKTDMFVIRHTNSGSCEFVSQNCDASVVNAGDGRHEHPTQALLDLFTILEHKKSFKNLTVAIIGDLKHSRVARSNIWAMKTLGINVKIFGPNTMMPRNAEIFGCEICKSMEDAISGSDVVMMLRIQLERQDGSTPFPSTREYAKFFGLNKQRANLANKNAIILHPGPINRGVEIDSDVADSKCSVILDQVENGVAIRMAVLDTLMRNRG